MVSVDWPSGYAPGICPFRLAAPAGWSAVEPPGALLALLAPEVAGFRSNVVVFGGRVPDSEDLGDIADSALAHCEPESVVGPVLDQPEQERAMAVAVRRGTAVTDGTRLVQLVAVTTAQDASPAGLRSVYVLLGTCPEDRAETDEPLLTGTISSFSTRHTTSDR